MMLLKPHALPIERIDYRLAIDSPQPITAPKSTQDALKLSLLVRGALKSAIERSDSSLLMALFKPEAYRRARGEPAPSNSETPGFRLHVRVGDSAAPAMDRVSFVLRLTLFGRAAAFRGEIEKALALAFIRRHGLPCLLEQMEPPRRNVFNLDEMGSSSRKTLPNDDRCSVELATKTPWLLGKATVHFRKEPDALALLRLFVKRAQQVAECWGDSDLIQNEAWAAWQDRWSELERHQRKFSAQMAAHQANIGSNRQGLRYAEPGVRGTFRFDVLHTEFSSLCPLLLFAQQLGVGTQTTGGYGRLRVVLSTATAMHSSTLKNNCS